MQTFIVCFDNADQFFKKQTLVNPSGPDFKTAFQDQLGANSGKVLFFMLPKQKIRVLFSLLLVMSSDVTRSRRTKGSLSDSLGYCQNIIVNEPINMIRN